MVSAAISGMEFWHNTEFGKALAKVLPPKLTRVIIDIPIKGAVKIYYASLETGPILDLKWDEIIEQFEVVKPKGTIPIWRCRGCGYTNTITVPPWECPACGYGGGNSFLDVYEQIKGN